MERQVQIVFLYILSQVYLSVFRKSMALSGVHPHSDWGIRGHKTTGAVSVVKLLGTMRMRTMVTTCACSALTAKPLGFPDLQSSIVPILEAVVGIKGCAQ